MRTNIRPPAPLTFTHEGARAANISPYQQLRRSVLSNFLFEGEFYEDGVSIASRIGELVKMVAPIKVASLALEARTQMNLRHVPLLLMAHLAHSPQVRGTSLIADTLPGVIQRADEISEFLAIYAKVNGVTASELKPKLSNQVRKALGRAFNQFGAYALAKYDRDGAVTLRDALRLCHPKPKDERQSEIFNQLSSGTLPIPDTWETQLSAGADKKETFTRLLQEGKLGYLALLRNLRNMHEASVDYDLIDSAILARGNGAERVLPFRFVAAARAVPIFEPVLDKALLASLADLPKFSGETLLMVDVSDSMNAPLSARSDLTRMDAAATLAAIFPGRHRVFTFSNRLVEEPPRLGMAGVDAIKKSQPHQGTALIEAVRLVNENVSYDRLIIITDEQASQARGMKMPPPKALGYVINVASALHGVGYGPWLHIDGFSENVLRWIAEHELESS